MRIKSWTKLEPHELWRKWRELFTSYDEAIAHAMWVANRLVKERAHSTRNAFYQLKDEFLRQYGHCLVDGRRVRVETRYCYACHGEGVEHYEEQRIRGFKYPANESDNTYPCLRCGGTGFISRRTLYVHNLILAGQRYSFHSYVEPPLLSNELGEDKETYGGRFSDEELAKLALPISGLGRVIGYVAVEHWGTPVLKISKFWRPRRAISLQAAG
jgi:hypothetical protein